MSHASGGQGRGGTSPQPSPPRYLTLQSIIQTPYPVAKKAKYARQLAKWLRAKADRAERYADKINRQ